MTDHPPPGYPPAPPAPVPAARTPWTILEVLKWTTARFTERGLDSPRLDAELLAAHALGLARIQLYAQFDRPLSAPELAGLRDLVRRRQSGEPVAYITGRKEFWSLDLAVDNRVLVPRPETELAVEESLAMLPPAAADLPSPRLCDVGTGSGAIALALAKERTDAQVIAIDVSADALAVARANAERLGLAVDFRQGHLLVPVTADEALDLIVANLPYVRAGDIARLAPEVRHEPAGALDGGADGLDLVRALVAGASARLRPGGALVLEIGAGQAPAVAELCMAAGLVEVARRRDLSGIERVVRARRAGQSERG